MTADRSKPPPPAFLCCMMALYTKGIKPSIFGEIKELGKVKGIIRVGFENGSSRVCCLYRGERMMTWRDRVGQLVFYDMPGGKSERDFTGETRTQNRKTTSLG